MPCLFQIKCIFFSFIYANLGKLIQIAIYDSVNRIYLIDGRTKIGIGPKPRDPHEKTLALGNGANPKNWRDNLAANQNKNMNVR